MALFRALLFASCCACFILAKPAGENLYKVLPYNLRSLNIIQRPQTNNLARLNPFTFLSGGSNSLSSFRLLKSRMSSAERHIDSLEENLSDTSRRMHSHERSVERRLDSREKSTERKLKSLEDSLEDKIDSVEDKLVEQIENHSHDSDEDTSTECKETVVLEYCLSYENDPKATLEEADQYCTYKGGLLAMPDDGWGTIAFSAAFEAAFGPGTGAAGFYVGLKIDSSDNVVRYDGEPLTTTITRIAIINSGHFPNLEIADASNIATVSGSPINTPLGYVCEYN